jgi:hypothetical protein
MRYVKQRTHLENTCSGNWIHTFTTCITVSDISRFRCYFDIDRRKKPVACEVNAEELEMNIPLSGWKSSIIVFYSSIVFLGLAVPGSRQGR